MNDNHNLVEIDFIKFHQKSIKYQGILVYSKRREASQRDLDVMYLQESYGQIFSSDKKKNLEFTSTKRSDRGTSEK